MEQSADQLWDGGPSWACERDLHGSAPWRATGGGGGGCGLRQDRASPFSHAAFGSGTGWLCRRIRGEGGKSRPGPSLVFSPFCTSPLLALPYMSPYPTFGTVTPLAPSIQPLSGRGGEGGNTLFTGNLTGIPQTSQLFELGICDPHLSDEKTKLKFREVK